uniref:Uncharacterized protein n=1 Tax=Gopherus agassizii TaxID=38772 RepID=A0A452IYY3_9SAUR
MTRLFSLAECDVLSFGLDHTLCRYNLPETARLIYDSFARYLVTEKGYDKELLTVTPESWDFCCKGLALDLEDGNFLKLAGAGTILRASHNTKSVTPEEILEGYGRREWKHFKTFHSQWDPNKSILPCVTKYYCYDNYFDLPGALLCARIVDCLDKHVRQTKYNFWKDVIAAIQHNYKTLAFKSRQSTWIHQRQVMPHQPDCLLW